MLRLNRLAARGSSTPAASQGSQRARIFAAIICSLRIEDGSSRLVASSQVFPEAESTRRVVGRGTVPFPPCLIRSRSSSLRSAPLDGVFVSITPGDPSLWVGVIFVRKGTLPSGVDSGLHPSDAGPHQLIWAPQCSHPDRPICSCGFAFPDIVPSHISNATSSRDLLYRCLPSAAHASYHVHVHYWLFRHRHCECNR